VRVRIEAADRNLLEPPVVVCCVDGGGRLQAALQAEVRVQVEQHQSLDFTVVRKGLRYAEYPPAVPQVEVAGYLAAERLAGDLGVEKVPRLAHRPGDDPAVADQHEHAEAASADEQRPGGLPEADAAAAQRGDLLAAGELADGGKGGQQQRHRQGLGNHQRQLVEGVAQVVTELRTVLDEIVDAFDELDQSVETHQGGENQGQLAQEEGGQVAVNDAHGVL
jgi:hypothetical protein